MHGPLNPVVDPAEALVETDGVLARIEGGRFRPATPAELSYAVTSAVARRQSGLVGDVAEKLPGLEQQVMASQLRRPRGAAGADVPDPARADHRPHDGRPVATTSRPGWLARTGSCRRAGRGCCARDLADQFDRVRSLADGEAQFLFGVIELYQTKVHTKMTVAMERLAVIAAVTLPVTAIASVYGMNVIVNQHTHVTQLVVVVAAMLVITGLLLRWAHRQGWW